MSELPEYPHFPTQTLALRKRLATVIAAIPHAHLPRPVKNEIFTNPEDAFIRIRDWGFTQGVLLVKESTSEVKGRWQIECSRHHKQTSDWRKTPAPERQRVGTHFQANGCKFSLYISRRKRMNNQWAIGWTHEEHNHPPLADPFVLDKLKVYEPNHQRARQLASTHRGIASYSDSNEILKNQGLHISAREFYNLTRKEKNSPLNNHEELELLLGILERAGFHPRTREEYLVVDDIRTSRVVRDIFFMSDEQVRLARRFVSSFMYETDATFNTNTRRLPLSVMVGIDNTGKTFPMAFMFITSESAKSFVFASQCLTDLCFYDCPEARVICGDFSKGLGAAIAMKAQQDAAKEAQLDDDRFAQGDKMELDETKVQCSVNLLEGDTIIVDVEVGSHGERTLLQLCEWHAIEAIKRRLIHSGRYSKETREELVDLLNRWVKAPLEGLEKARNILLGRLHKQERDYLRQYYQPKEVQFCRAYTRTYINLGVHSTQRNESYHVVVKKRLHKNLSVSDAIEAIVAKTLELAEEYNARINNNRKNTPRLMDIKAFRKVGSLLTHYAIDLTMVEWRAAKDLSDQIDGGDVKPFDFEEALGCQFECELPARFRLPCKHWMLQFYLRGEPLPLSLFHPRWLLDGPGVVRGWKMKLSSVVAVQSVPTSASNPLLTPAGPSSLGDPRRYADDGAQMIIDAAAKAVEKLRSLPAGQKESFATGFEDLTMKLSSRVDDLMASRQAVPAELPAPLPQPNVKFKANRRRGYTGREAAEEEEKDAIRAARRATREADLRKIEDATRRQDL
jgi:hypothetical protein